jgi:hypothetical protein
VLAAEADGFEFVIELNCEMEIYDDFFPPRCCTRNFVNTPKMPAVVIIITQAAASADIATSAGREHIVRLKYNQSARASTRAIPPKYA